VFDRYGQPIRLAEKDEAYRDDLEITPYQTNLEALSIRRAEERPHNITL
jgi:hypothetical protein